MTGWHIVNGMVRLGYDFRHRQLWRPSQCCHSRIAAEPVQVTGWMNANRMLICCRPLAVSHARER